MLNLFKRKPPQFFSAEEQDEIVAAIKKAETTTEGEIRIYVESRSGCLDTIDRAQKIFSRLHMHETKQHNAVLLYVAMEDRQLAIYADSGIYNHAGKEYWNDEVKTMLEHFDRQDYVAGIVRVIGEIGEALSRAFPYDATTDTNELPDDIVFGR